MIAEDRINLIDRIYSWLFDNTESWLQAGLWFNVGLNYLIWSIAAGDGTGLDTTSEQTEYKSLVDMLRANPNGLLEELIQHGYIII